MRDDICTIPVSEVFEQNDGCPICRMRDIIEERITDYIMGDAMMEPDVRIETNKVGFCEFHYDKMLNHRGRLQLALMLQTHIDEINSKIFSKNLFNSNAKKGENAKKISETCFICDKIEWGLSRMVDTVYRCYEQERDFRDMFNSQKMFCLPHYEMLINGGKKKIKRYSKEFSDNLTRITGDYSKSLSADVSKFCTMYDYRSRNVEDGWGNSRNSVERAIAFLNGRHFEE